MNKLFYCLAFVLAVFSGHAAAEGEGRLGLRLAPAALGQSLALQQHLHVERGARSDDLDAALEIDADALTLVGMAFGQKVLSLHYDGSSLQSWRHPRLPEQVRSEDVLEDIQLTYWPLEAIRPALPAGWEIVDEAQRRTLSRDGAVMMVIEYGNPARWPGEVRISNLRYGYRLTIQSVLTGP
jgi:hypothetical protein